MTGTNEPANAAQDDPLLHLHRMSTTAGAGTQEYVAVNVTAVIAFLFGVASVLALLEPALLVVPGTAIVLSLVSWRQIRNSNGTQTGKGLCVLGLLLAVGLGGGYFAYQAVQAVHRRPDKEQIAGLCVQFGQTVATAQFEKTYALFDPDFKQRIDLPHFKAAVSQFVTSTVVPHLVSAEWNNLANFGGDPDSGVTAQSMIVMKFNDGESPRLPINFRRQDDGTWKIDDIPDLFPPPAKPSGGQ